MNVELKMSWKRGNRRLISMPTGLDQVQTHTQNERYEGDNGLERAVSEV